MNFIKRLFMFNPFGVVFDYVILIHGFQPGANHSLTSRFSGQALRGCLFTNLNVLSK